MVKINCDVFIDGKLALEVVGIEFAKGYDHSDRGAEQVIVEYPNGCREWFSSNRVEVVYE